MKTVFAPGCALYLYKPELAEKIFKRLKGSLEGLQEHSTCCHHKPQLPEGTTIINICPGCDRRYRSLYEGISTVSLWEIIDGMDSFAFPDYDGMQVSILDACPTRTEDRVHSAIRNLLKKMNIKITEPAHTRTNGKCCGDTFYGKLSKNEVIGHMKNRADEMPEEKVAVYCVSCVKSIKNGGKTPLYLPDLLFGEHTVPGECDPDQWHSQVDKFIEAH